MIGRDLSYHGTTVATLAAGGHEKRRAPFGPLLYDWPKAPACFCLRCPLGRTYPGCETACADALDEVLEREGPETVAAFVAEPECNGVAERFIRTLKEQLLWAETFDTIEELRLALIAFKHGYNAEWLVQKHGHITPAQARANLAQSVAVAA